MAKTRKPQFLLLDTYLDFIKGSAASKMFRVCYFKIGGKKIEVLENGNLACAYYLTSILKTFSLIKNLHTTVAGAEKDLLESGWYDIKKPRAGCIIIYAPKNFKIVEPNRYSGYTHRHLGFYVGNGKDIDNSSSKGSPQIHAWNHRPVERLLWHKNLEH